MSTITNTSQLLGKGAKRRINHSYCDLLAVTKRPDYLPFGIFGFEFAGGVIEINGTPYDFDESLDLTGLGALVSDGNYIVAAVPGYLEPADVNAAAAAGVSYYTYNDAQRQTFAKPFVDPAVGDAVNALGGCAALSQKVYGGCATQAEIQAFNDYHAAKKKIVDPRCSLKTLCPNGAKLVLIKVQEQNNAGGCNALEGMTACEFEQLRARIGSLCSERSFTTPTDFQADYPFSDNVRHIVKSLFTYPDQAAYDAGNAGTEHPFPYDVRNAITAGDTFAVLEIYTYPGSPVDCHGKAPKILDMLSYEKSELLGRINPIYLSNDAPNAGICKTGSSRLTGYGDPLPLVEVEIDAAAQTVTLVREIYESYV